jgi:hypothetical protein
VTAALGQIGGNRTTKAPARLVDEKDSTAPVMVFAQTIAVETSETDKRRSEHVLPNTVKPRQSDQEDDLLVNAIPAIPRFFATYPTVGTAFIGVLTAVATVVTLQSILPNAAGNLSIAIGIGVIGAFVGFLAYAAWNAATGSSSRHESWRSAHRGSSEFAASLLGFRHGARLMFAQPRVRSEKRRFVDRCRPAGRKRPAQLAQFPHAQRRGYVVLRYGSALYCPTSGSQK